MICFKREELKIRPSSSFAEQHSIRFQDVDAAGIIFYPRLFEHCHDVLVSFFAAHGSPLDQVLREGNWIAPIRHAEADYFRPLRFGDRVEVAIVRARLQATEVTLGFRLARLSEDAEVCAVAQSVHTFVDPRTFMRIPVPETLAAALAAIGG
jgi:YbgC/YbaW family acyl-CoA thioester hydrolase